MGALLATAAFNSCVAILTYRHAREWNSSSWMAVAFLNGSLAFACIVGALAGETA